jgi:hypothetical protein
MEPARLALVAPPPRRPAIAYIRVDDVRSRMAAVRAREADVATIVGEVGH